MSNISLTDFQRRYFKPIFRLIDDACEQIGIDFYLVGAVARDISITLYGLEPTRATRDLDLAVFVLDEAHYNHLLAILLQNKEFAPVRQMPFTLLYNGKVPVDLIPFGGLGMNGEAQLNRGEGVTRIAIDGLKEVYDLGTHPVTLDEELTFRVCSLPGMVLLKLIAYDDRPELRLKDLSDIAFILKNYGEIAEEEVFEKHYDILESSASIHHTAARILGRHMRPLLDTSPALRQRITGILDRAIASGPDGTVIYHLQTAQYPHFPLSYVAQLLQQLRQGLDH